mgnify:CR=1 FL=1
MILVVIVFVVPVGVATAVYLTVMFVQNGSAILVAFHLARSGYRVSTASDGAGTLAAGRAATFLPLRSSIVAPPWSSGIAVATVTEAGRDQVSRPATSPFSYGTGYPSVRLRLRRPSGILCHPALPHPLEGGAQVAEHRLPVGGDGRAVGPVPRAARPQPRLYWVGTLGNPFLCLAFDMELEFLSEIVLASLPV